MVKNFNRKPAAMKAGAYISDSAFYDAISEGSFPEAGWLHRTAFSDLADDTIAIHQRAVIESSQCAKLESSSEASKRVLLEVYQRLMLERSAPQAGGRCRLTHHQIESTFCRVEKKTPAPLTTVTGVKLRSTRRWIIFPVREAQATTRLTVRIAARKSKNSTAALLGHAALIDAGARGLSVLDAPLRVGRPTFTSSVAPALMIERCTNITAAPSAGDHARYRVNTPVEIVERVAA